jgi:hypothetical protein
LVEEIGINPADVATSLVMDITLAARHAYERGDPRMWAFESFGMSIHRVYVVGSAPGCDAGRGAITLPQGYQASAETLVKDQLKRAGVRLAWLLNRIFDPSVGGPSPTARNGDVLLHCVGRDDGSIESCKVIGEDPPDQGYGAQALGLASKFRTIPRPPSDKGKPPFEFDIPVGFPQ